MSDNKHHSPPRPDLDDEMNVTETHASVGDATPATIRERGIAETGSEPVPLWLILCAGIALLVGGVVLGKGGSLIDYSQESMWANAYAPNPELGSEAPTEGEALKFMVQQGSKSYGTCAACHGASGGGGTCPPLAGSEWVIGDDTQALAMIILNGLNGPITVKGQSYNLVMAKPGSYDAKQLASLMTYLRSGLNNVGDIVTLEMAQKAIDAAEARGTDKLISVAELESGGYMKPLEGAPLEPSTIISFETYQPVGGAE